MKKLLSSLLFCGALLGAVSCTTSGPTSNPEAAEAAAKPTPGPFVWETSFAKARQRAAAEKKHLLMDFTGSDWCHWCVQLDREVFEQPAFAQFARENLVLLKLDFPQGKPLPAALAKQNDALAAQFGIEGFPTLVVLGPDGKPDGTMGYVAGGPNPFLSELRKIMR